MVKFSTIFEFEDSKDFHKAWIEIVVRRIVFLDSKIYKYLKFSRILLNEKVSYTNDILFHSVSLTSLPPIIYLIIEKSLSIRI